MQHVQRYRTHEPLKIPKFASSKPEPTYATSTLNPKPLYQDLNPKLSLTPAPQILDPRLKSEAPKPFIVQVLSKVPARALEAAVSSGKDGR